MLKKLVDKIKKLYRKYRKISKFEKATRNKYTIDRITTDANSCNNYILFKHKASGSFVYTVLASDDSEQQIIDNFISECNKPNSRLVYLSDFLDKLFTLECKSTNLNVSVRLSGFYSFDSQRSKEENILEIQYFSSLGSNCSNVDNILIGLSVTSFLSDIATKPVELQDAIYSLLSSIIENQSSDRFIEKYAKVVKNMPVSLRILKIITISASDILNTVTFNNNKYIVLEDLLVFNTLDKVLYPPNTKVYEKIMAKYKLANLVYGG